MAVKQVKELEHLMQEAFDKKANILYMMPNEPPIFRVKNLIERSQGDSFTVEQIKNIAIAAIGKDALKDIGPETGQSTTLCTLPGIVDGRMYVAKVSGDYIITILLLPTSLPDAECLRMPQAILEAAMSPNGLVLFSGLPGSGKTTNLFSTMDYINTKKPCIICTVEDSIGYNLTGKKAIVQQREVGIDVPDMITGISTSIAQWPDVLMINELINPEEFNMCIMASQGTLILTQLNVDSPQAAIQGMIDIFPENTVAVPRRILAKNLRGVCCQVLLKRADGKGKVAAYGVLIPDEQMRKDIAEGHDIFDRKTPLPDSCRTIAEDIEKLHSDGVISKKTRDHAIG